MSTHKSFASFKRVTWYGAMVKVKFLPGESKYSFPSITYLPYSIHGLLDLVHFPASFCNSQSRVFEWSILTEKKTAFLNSNLIGNSRATDLSVKDCCVSPSWNKVDLFNSGWLSPRVTSAICLSCCICVKLAAAGDFSAGMKPTPCPFWISLVVRAQSFFHCSMWNEMECWLFVIVSFTWDTSHLSRPLSSPGHTYTISTGQGPLAVNYVLPWFGHLLRCCQLQTVYRQSSAERFLTPSHNALEQIP